MDLVQATWMIRDLGQSVSAIDMEKESIIAGGWDGVLKMWNADGDLLWQAQCADRIEAILRIDDLVVVTSGLNISCVRQGEIIWSNPLEGSADLLAYHEGEIIATSSVYDIEHGDFMESAVWRFSLKGEMNEVVRMDERPWFIHKSQHLILGLGRPKCGLLVDGSHQDLPTDSPVTCGSSEKGKLLFGHSNGVITSFEGEIVVEEDASIESITCNEEGFVSALETGKLVARRTDSTELWVASGNQITTQVAGFDNLHWCGRWDSLTGMVEVREASGKLFVTANTSRPRVSDTTLDRVCFGFEDGQVMVWEKELFYRRSKQEVKEENSRKSTLAAKLRSLRN